MTQSHSTASTVEIPGTVLELVGHALAGEPVMVVDGVAGGVPPTAAAQLDRLVDELVGAAVASSRRLQLASRFWLADTGRSMYLAQVMVDAITLGLGSSAAVNVAAAMVGAVAAGDEREVAELLTRARMVLTDADLRRGAAALMAALTIGIARALDLDAAAVEIELRQPGRLVPDLLASGTSHRTLLPRTNRA